MQADLALKVERMQTRLDRIEQAFSTNTSAFVDSIKMLEVQQHVGFLIMQDVFNGRVRIKSTSSDADGIPRAEVDIPSYMRDYLTALAQQEEAAAAPEASPLVSASDESPIIFGGDG